MSKNQNKKSTNVVEEYLVERIKELEKKVKGLEEDITYFMGRNTDLNEVKEKFDQVKKMFELSGDGITKAIIVRDLHSGYVGILAIDSNEDFNEYLELLELNGKGEQK